MTTTNKIASVLIAILEPLPSERAEAIYTDIVHRYKQMPSEAMDTLLALLQEIINP